MQATLYKQRQAEICKKSSKNWTTPWGFRKLFAFLIHVIIQERYKKQLRLFKWSYMINNNENEAENEK